MKYPNVIHVSTVQDICDHAAVEIGGKWYPARPLGFYSAIERVRAAWKVFTGKADALVWPGGQ